MTFQWTDETVALATECYMGGQSAAETARTLFNRYGIKLSRNAVIGKLNRIGVAQKRAATPSAPKPLKTNTRYAAPDGVRAPKVRKTYKKQPKKPLEPRFKVIVAGNGSTFVHENFRQPQAVAKTPPAEIALAPRFWETRRFGECAFPVGDCEEGVMSCCNATGGRAYCGDHAKLMFTPRAKKPKTVRPFRAVGETVWGVLDSLAVRG